MTELKVIINYIPWDVTHIQLSRFLRDQTHGLVRCNIVKHPDTGISLGYGFADYQGAMAATFACWKLSGMPWKNKYLQVSMAKPRSENTNGNLAVSGFPLEWDAFELAAYFGQFGNVVSCTIPLDKITGKSLNRAYVRMDTGLSAQDAISFPHIYGVPMNVSQFSPTKLYHEHRSGKEEPCRRVPNNLVESTSSLRTVAFSDAQAKWTVLSATIYFTQFGLLERVQIIMPAEEGAGSRIVLVTFRHADVAKKVFSMSQLLGLKICRLSH